MKLKLIKKGTLIIALLTLSVTNAQEKDTSKQKKRNQIQKKDSKNLI